MQNKKALALAIAAALWTPYAMASTGSGSTAGEDVGPDSVVELYGRSYPEFIRPYGSGATPVGTTVANIQSVAVTGVNSIITRNEVEASNTRLGFKGSERLGGSLKAIWQLETEFRIDQNNTGFAQRDSFVGLQHPGWGAIRLGRMDTPFKNYGDDVSFLGISSGNFVSTSNVMRKTGFGTSSASSFHLRRANIVDYESPTMAGFRGRVQYSTDETDTSTRKPHVWSGGLRWEGSRFEFAAMHEIHWDLFGGSNNVPTAQRNNADQAVNSKDKATQVMGKVKLGNHTFEADYIWKQFDENATVTGRFMSYKNTAYQVLWDARWTPSVRTMVEYIKAMQGSCVRVNTTCTTGGLGGWQFQYGLAYYFSKRTYLFLMHAILHNGYSATYNNEGLQAPSVGEQISQVAVGISHTW